MNTHIRSIVLVSLRNFWPFVFLMIWLSACDPTCDPKLPADPKIVVPVDYLIITEVQQSDNCSVHGIQCDITLKGKATGKIIHSPYKFYVYYKSEVQAAKKWLLSDPKQGVPANEQWQISIRLLASSVDLWDREKFHFRVLASDSAKAPDILPNNECPGICSDSVSLTISKVLLPPIPILSGGDLIFLTVVPFKPYVYVADRSEKVIPVRTSPSPAEETPISLDYEPKGIVASPGGREVYVSSHTDSTIRIINVDTKKESERIKLAGSPSSIDITPAGDYLYAVCPEQSLVYIIDTNKASRNSVPFGNGGPFDVATGRFTKTGYVTDTSSTKIYLVRPQATKDSIEFKNGLTPSRIAVSPDERFAVVTLWNRGQSISQPKVMFINLEIKFAVQPPLEVGGTPESVAITPDARSVLVTDRTSGEVIVIDVPTRLDSFQVKHRFDLNPQTSSSARDIAIDHVMNRAYIINRTSGFELSILRLDLIRP